MRVLKPVPAAFIAGFALVGFAVTFLISGISGSPSPQSAAARISVQLPVDSAVSSTVATTPGKVGGLIQARSSNTSHAASGDGADTLSRQVFHYSGTIKGSLFEAAAAQGVPLAVMADVVHVFSYDVDFQRDLQAGDQFEVLAERFIDSSNHVRATNVLFASLTLSGDRLTAYRYTDGTGGANYYSSKGESLRKGLLKTPVAGADISSGFGMRVNPILGFSMLHKGVDFAVVSGTPVMAAGDGIVEVVGTKGAYGRYLKIRHDEIHETAYAHLSKYAKGIHPGSHVAQGEIVAYSGTSGRSTGPHLHYEVLVNDAQVNPVKVKFPAHFKLSGHELARFLGVVKEAGQEIAAIPVTTKVALAHPTNALN
jgi:murein DD-endopeptidase MepM/ murein hydrolase activator NlpD